MNTKILLPLLASGFGLSVFGSSHREAPAITSQPKLDCSDYYAFNSYEPARGDYVTLIANYLPLQDAYGGPNYFQLDPQALYEIHVDNTGDAVEDLTFQFRFQNAARDIALVIGTGDNRRTNAIPLLAAGQITAGNNGALNVDQTYTLSVIRGPRRTGSSTPVLNPANNTPNFTKPQDNVGNKTFPEYTAYADQYIYEIALPGTDKKGKVFVGQRKDPFVVNLGETFDLINLNPLGTVDGAKDSLADKNVTALCLELPKEFLLAGGNGPIIGTWTTASRVDGTTITQVSRLGMPLVNEVVIGLKHKDVFNASEPKDDLQFVDYITHPTLPALIEILFPIAKAPTTFPRADLVAAFATGVEGLNKNGSLGEMQRLNTAIPATPRDSQNNLGVIAGITGGVLDPAKADLAGFPNGRRPGDDVVDIELRVAMGKLLTPAEAPVGDAPITDGALVNASFFANQFPYLLAPLGGSPNDLSITIQPQAGASLNGPLRPVPGKFDPATRRLTVTAPAEGSSFLGVKADAKVTLSQPAAAAGELSAKVQ
ncbi:MAG: DUF4331 domain-containing protein [Verrucomicrobia bacterium]|nr:DUF4331 domain-containing protein [Verrucomicrobiota bacterium]